MIVDAYRALALLGTHPAIDRDRIAVSRSPARTLASTSRRCRARSTCRGSRTGADAASARRRRASSSMRPRGSRCPGEGQPSSRDAMSLRKCTAVERTTRAILPKWPRASNFPSIFSHV